MIAALNAVSDLVPHSRTASARSIIIAINSLRAADYVCSSPFPPSFFLFLSLHELGPIATTLASFSCFPLLYLTG
jgi:hypothetical protein